VNIVGLTAEDLKVTFFQIHISPLFFFHQVFGRIIICTGRVFILGKMVDAMMESTRMTKSTALEYILGKGKIKHYFILKG